MTSQNEHPNTSSIDPSLHQGPLPSPEQIHELVYEFWHSDPTEVWQPYVDATNASIESDVGVTMLSGIHGIGKSMIYGTRLSEGRGDVRIIGDLIGEKVWPKASFEGDTITGRAHVILLDEAVASAERSQQFAETAKNGIEAGKQFVFTVPGPNLEARSKIVEGNTAALKERGIEVKYLGDISNVHIPAERTTSFLRSLGVNNEVASLFEELEPLRAPRMFGALIDAFTRGNLVLKPNELSKQQVLNVVTGLIDSSKTDKDTLEYVRNTAGNLVGVTPIITTHVPFRTGSLSTKDAVALYAALHTPLPTAADFPNKEHYDYAFNKN